MALFGRKSGAVYATVATHLRFCAVNGAIRQRASTRFQRLSFATANRT
jgi:hypothetical protein